MVSYQNYYVDIQEPKKLQLQTHFLLMKMFLQTANIDNEEYKKIIQFIEKNNNKNLQFKSYRKYITETAENYSFIPADISLEKE